MKQTAIVFGLLFFCVLLLFQLMKFYRFRSDWSEEIWIGAFSLVFFSIGIFLSRKFQKEKVLEKQVFIYRDEFVPDQVMLSNLRISKREFEVLCLISQGLSNQQIADQLFVSENTVKKHISSLFLKLEVERRTEAVHKARALRLVS